MKKVEKVATGVSRKIDKNWIMEDFQETTSRKFDPGFYRFRTNKVRLRLTCVHLTRNNGVNVRKISLEKYG